MHNWSEASLSTGSLCISTQKPNTRNSASLNSGKDPNALRLLAKRSG